VDNSGSGFLGSSASIMVSLNPPYLPYLTVFLEQAALRLHLSKRHSGGWPL
jgi:hypothetical protein